MFKPLRHTFARVLALTCLLACLPAVAHAAESSTGGVSPDDPRYAPAEKAKIVNGYAVPPKSAPRRVKRAMEAANDIIRKPYKYGGGHASVEDKGYDCSGTVSYALIGADLLKRPLDSGSFMSWAQKGKGKWISVYAHGGHAYAVIAGLRLDTGSRDPNAARYGTAPGSGPRWNKTMRDSSGYRVRHPAGF
ncbi:MAG: peptidoglycan endopeptidase [Thermoleophilaceae bacterium]